MTKKEIINKALELLFKANKDGISNYKIAKYTEITEATIGNYINKITKPTYANAKILISYFETNIKENTENQTIVKSNKGIPLIPLDAMAGFGKGEIQVIEYECERYIVPIFREAEFLIMVKGSSMIPKYNSGDLVACKKLPLNDLFFQWNKVYVLDTEQGALVKRIKKGSDNEHILLVSDNESYEPFELHKSQINAVALVVGVLRLE